MVTYVRQKAVGNMAATFKLQNLVKRVKLLATYCCNAHPKLNNSPSWTSFRKKLC